MHTYIHTYIHTYTYTDRQTLLFDMWVWRRKWYRPHSNTTRTRWGCDCFPPFPCSSMSPFLIIISSNMSNQCLWSVNSSWIMCSRGLFNTWPVLLVLLHLLTRLSEQWSHNVNYDHKKWHDVMNNVCCTTTASKAQIVWLKDHRMCNHNNTQSTAGLSRIYNMMLACECHERRAKDALFRWSKLSMPSSFFDILIGWTLANAVMVMLE